jgi:hypothetical protein
MGHKKSTFLSFSKAKKKVKKLKFKHTHQWTKWASSKERPKNMPSNPHIFYSEWLSWYDWLGVRPGWDGKYLPFEEAREYAHSLRLKSMREWVALGVKGKLKMGVPTYPMEIYRGEYSSSKDWLMGWNKTFMPYQEARALMRKEGIDCWDKWKAYAKSDKRPLNLPLEPKYVYRDEWLSWSDWVGDKIGWNGKWRPYEQAREYINSLQLQGQDEFRRWIADGHCPHDIPSNPHTVYSEWVSDTEWFGVRKPKYRPYEEALNFIHELKLTRMKDYRALYSAGKIPTDIPKNPHATYKKEWNSWYEFLGKPRFKYRNYEEALKLAHSLSLKKSKDWEDLHDSGKLPNDVPRNPLYSYKEEWESWYEFLGKDKLNA